jgi:thiol-disulfide isomerase/thioredoxin
MRKLIFAALLVMGCQNSDLSNRGSQNGVNYPPEPYGYKTGTIIANLQFFGKVDPQGATGTATYSDLDAKTFNFSDYYNDPSVSWLVLTGAAGWCGPCKEEASTMPATSTKWEPMGARFITVLIQGFDESTGAPATLADVDLWQQKMGEHIALATDPKDNLHDFADMIASFPLNMIIRTADMSIMYSQIGLAQGEASIDPVLSSFASR